MLFLGVGSSRQSEAVWGGLPLGAPPSRRLLSAKCSGFRNSPCLLDPPWSTRPAGCRRSQRTGLPARRLPWDRGRLARIGSAQQSAVAPAKALSHQMAFQFSLTCTRTSFRSILRCRLKGTLRFATLPTL